jgi:hypothetical protein
MTRMDEAAFRSRALILAPVGRDAALTGSLLDRGGVESVVCSDLHELQRNLVEGAGAAVITEEALIGQHIRVSSNGSRTNPPGRISPLSSYWSREPRPKRAVRSVTLCSSRAI